jgi:hypothetical protein
LVEEAKIDGETKMSAILFTFLFKSFSPKQFLLLFNADAKGKLLSASLKKIGPKRHQFLDFKNLQKIGLRCLSVNISYSNEPKINCI